MSSVESAIVDCIRKFFRQYLGTCICTSGNLLRPLNERAFRKEGISFFFELN